MIYVFKIFLDVFKRFGDIGKIYLKAGALVLFDFGDIFGKNTRVQNDDSVFVFFRCVVNKRSYRYIKVGYIIIVR